MKYLLLVFFCLASAYAVTNPQHWAFANKVINMGVKLINNKTIYNTSLCMDPFIYNCSTMDVLQTQLQKCGMANAGSVLGTAYTLYASLDSCLQKANDTVMNLITNLMKSNSNLIDPYFNTGVANVKKWKAAKQAKNVVLENFYKWAAAQFNKSIINTYCTNFIKSKKVSPAQWQCLVSSGKSALDLSAYKCATMTP